MSANTIYLVDYIGDHCGMHYYLEAFRTVLSKSLPDADIKILSNYKVDDSDPFFLNQYQGSIVRKGTSLLRNIMRLRRFVRSHRDEVFIYLTYGNAIDIPFIKAVCRAPRHLIDIHEAIAQDVDSNRTLKSRFRKLYSGRVRNVISHSSRTDNFLKEYSFTGKKFSVPHFKYIFPKDYDRSEIAPELLSAPRKGMVNLMFFGNLNESKGIDVLLEAINLLDDETASKVNLIVAGKDFDGSVHRVTPSPGRNVTLILRHISDPELRFLYQNVDFMVLPYRKTSQSGILEMAFYFKRPIIATDIPYFHRMLTEFPSFGVLTGMSSADIASSITKVANNEISPEGFFSEDDYSHYENRRSVADFVADFASYYL